MFAILLAQNSAQEAQAGVEEFFDKAHELIDIGADVLFDVGFVVALLFVVIGFVRYIVNDPEGGQTQVRNSIIGLALLGLSKVIIDLAQSIGERVQSRGSSDLGGAIASTVDEVILPLIYQWVGALAVMAIVWGGILYMTGQVKEGQTWIRNSLIGVAGILLAYALLTLVTDALGI